MPRRFAKDFSGFTKAIVAFRKAARLFPNPFEPFAKDLIVVVKGGESFRKDEIVIAKAGEPFRKDWIAIAKPRRSFRKRFNLIGKTSGALRNVFLIHRWCFLARINGWRSLAPTWGSASCRNSP